jgi:hypothetical protein
MRQGRLPHQAFVEGFDPEAGISLTNNALTMRKGTVTLVYSSFNRLQFKVYSETPSLFGLSYPFTGHWQAWVDNRKVSVYRANGGTHAVLVPEGESLVEFRYSSPAIFWGAIISCTSFIVLGIFVSCFCSRGIQRIFTFLVFVVISLSIFFLWSKSLYNGENLRTKFEWTYTPVDPSQRPNIAYGKKTSGFPLPKQSVFIREAYGGLFYRTHSSKAVDGDRHSGYEINLADNPSVIIDLHLTVQINSINLYESMDEPSMNGRQLEISIAGDDKSWDTVASIFSRPDKNDPVRIEFKSPRKARFIKINAAGSGRLILDEVEVY